MANRKRRDDECYRCYKRHLKEEERRLKNYLKGRIVWISTMIMPDPADQDKMPILRRLITLPVRGTFNRALGHEQRTSLIDQDRKKRVLKALQKRGII
jgi:hypothetical protein